MIAVFWGKPKARPDSPPPCRFLPKDDALSLALHRVVRESFLLTLLGLASLPRAGALNSRVLVVTLRRLVMGIKSARATGARC